MITSCFPSECTSQIFKNKVINASGSASFVVHNSCYSLAVITIRAEYNISANRPVRILWRYSANGNDYDAMQDAIAQENYEDLTLERGGSRTRTVFVPLLQDYTKIEIINQDTSYNATINVWRKLIG